MGSAHKRTGIPHFDNKWRIEETVPSLRFPSHVILRPVFFMENLLASYSFQGSCLWLTRWRGLPGWNSERNLLAGVLVGMPLIYVSRYLFASAGRMANYWFWVEVLGTITFVALAVLVRKRSPWFLAVGIVAPRISLGCLALPRLDLHPRLVRNCLTSPSERMWLHAFPRMRARRALR